MIFQSNNLLIVLMEMIVMEGIYIKLFNMYKKGELLKSRKININIFQRMVLLILLVLIKISIYLKLMDL